MVRPTRDFRHLSLLFLAPNSIAFHASSSSPPSAKTLTLNPPHSDPDRSSFPSPAASHRPSEPPSPLTPYFYAIFSCMYCTGNRFLRGKCCGWIFVCSFVGKMMLSRWFWGLQWLDLGDRGGICKGRIGGGPNWGGYG